MAPFAAIIVAFVCAEVASGYHVKDSGHSLHLHQADNATSREGDLAEVQSMTMLFPSFPQLGLLSALADFVHWTYLHTLLPKGEGSVPAVSPAADADAIDWIAVKVVVGICLLLPALKPMYDWEAKGRPPHPFLLSEHAREEWPNWLRDLVCCAGIVGADLLILAAVEYDWDKAIFFLNIFFILKYGVLGFCQFLYSTLSKNSHYGDAAVSQRTGKIKAPIVAINQYQDVGLSLVHAIVVVTSQCILMSLYLKEMWKHPGGASQVLSPQAYKYWAMTIPIQIVARELMGRSFCAELRLWHVLLQEHSRREIHLEVERGDSDEKKNFQVRFAESVARSIMSFFSNSFCISVIVLTLPLFMMSAVSDIDFVKDCFAVVFITTLDDLSDSVVMQFERKEGSDEVSNA